MHRAPPTIHHSTGIRPAHPQTLGKTPRSKTRCLLALDGQALNPSVISAAEAKCLNGSSRVDILLVNSPRAPEAVLHKLLISLEGMDVDYRLTGAEGELGELVTQYLRRHKGITQVMVANLSTLGKEWEAKATDLRYQGYRFCTLVGQKDE